VKTNGKLILNAISALSGVALIGFCLLTWHDDRSTIHIDPDSDLFFHSVPFAAVALLVASCYLVADLDPTLRKVGGWIGLAAISFGGSYVNPWIHTLSFVLALFLMGAAYWPRRKTSPKTRTTEKDQ